MDGFLATLSLTLTSTLTPQIVFSILGGFVGALIASDRKRYGWQLSILFGIVALFLAAGTGEYLVNVREITSVYWLFILNLPLGMVVGSTLDVLRITSPPLIEKLVKGIGDSGVNIIIEAVLVKLSNILGVKPPNFSRDETKTIDPKSDNVDVKDSNVEDTDSK